MFLILPICQVDAFRGRITAEVSYYTYQEFKNEHFFDNWAAYGLIIQI